MQEQKGKAFEKEGKERGQVKTEDPIKTNKQMETDRLSAARSSAVPCVGSAQEKGPRHKDLTDRDKCANILGSAPTPREWDADEGTNKMKREEEGVDKGRNEEKEDGWVSGEKRSGLRERGRVGGERKKRRNERREKKEGMREKRTGG